MIFVLVILLFILSFLSQTPRDISGSKAATPNSTILASPNPMNTTVAVNPTATIDLARSNTNIQVTINVTNAPPINGFVVSVAYQFRPWVLKASSLDFSTNVLSSFSSRFVQSYCLDGLNPDGNSGLCHSNDGQGVTSFGETILGGLTANHTSGSLFTITFSVNTSAPVFSQIRIAQVILSNGQIDPKTGQPALIPVTTSDGYYTSRSCGKDKNGQPIACAPASASFTWSPASPTQNQIIVFDGSASRPSPGAFIMNYSWHFDDSQSTGTNIDTGRNSKASHLYNIPGVYHVTLQITDNSTVIASKTNPVVVANAEKDVGIESLDVQPSVTGVLPGTVFQIKVVLRNFGGVAVNASLTLTLAGPAPQLLGSLPLARMNASATRVLTATWDSSGRIPNAYRIDALTPIQKDQTSTDKNLKSVWILLIYPSPAGLSLLGAAGITGVVVVAGGYGVSFLRKRNLNLDDAL